MITSALLFLAAIQAARAQGTSTATVFAPGFADDHLQGDVIGTGADGTTYRFSGVMFATESDPWTYTMTLVEDSTHVSIAADLVTLGLTVPIDVECSINGDAVCIEALGTGTMATTFTETGPVVLTAVPLGVTGSAQFTVTASGTPPSDVLPPSIAAPTTTTSFSFPTTLPTVSDSGPDAPASGAMRTFGTVALCCAAIPAILVFSIILL